MAVHPTASIEPGVSIGRGTAIWDYVHVRYSTRIGAECVIEEKTYIAHDVIVGDRVKIQAFVYVCPGVTIERGAFVGAGSVFTGDRFSPDPEDRAGAPFLREGCTVGAHCAIESGVTIGRFAKVNAGSVVTRDIPDFVHVGGNPAAPVGYVCACGQPLLPETTGLLEGPIERTCTTCSARYEIACASVTQLVLA